MCWKKNNYLQNRTEKTKDWAIQPHKKNRGMNQGVPAPLVGPVFTVKQLPVLWKS